MSEKTIVVSAVNLRKGGTLTILRQCLDHLSRQEGWRVIALVHDRSLFTYEGIEYIEIPWTTRSWAHRLWCEYVTMHRISRRLAAQTGEPVDVWLSLHDTTPRVVAKVQEVYCHTSFPFLKWTLRDFRMDPKVPLFAMFTRFAYRINIHRNSSIIVQQEWFADAMSRMLHVDRRKFRVIPPAAQSVIPPAWDGTAAPPLVAENLGKCSSAGTAASIWAGGKATAIGAAGVRQFFYASTPDCHKNFETLLDASRLLESKGYEFKVVVTVKGDENKYAKWLYARWGGLKSVDFHGLMPKDELFETYRNSGVFVFPSRVETWGLPISEYMSANPSGILLLADLPYAHETSRGAADVRYFKATDASSLAELMKQILDS